MMRWSKRANIRCLLSYACPNSGADWRPPTPPIVATVSSAIGTCISFAIWRIFSAHDTRERM